MSTLSTQEKSLLRQALAARENAYAPYSRFQVGAVLTVADGSTFCGCIYTPQVRQIHAAPLRSTKSLLINMILKSLIPE